MRIRHAAALAVAAGAATLLIGCSAVLPGGGMPPAAPGGEGPGAPAIAGVGAAECASALAGFDADERIVGVSDGTPLSPTELAVQVRELFGAGADPVLSLLTPQSCAVLNSVSGVRVTAWNIVIPGLDADTARHAAAAMSMELTNLAGFDVEYYRPDSGVPDDPLFVIYLDDALTGFPIPDTVVLGLEIEKPLASAIDTADVSDLDGTYCLPGGCRATWKVAMPELVMTNPAVTLTTRIALAGEDSGCLLLSAEEYPGDTFVYCPAGVPTPEKWGGNLRGDDEHRARMWWALPRAAGTDAYLKTR